MLRLVIVGIVRISCYRNAHYSRTSRTMLRSAFLILFHLITIVDVGFTTKTNLLLCEFNAPCSSSDNLDRPTPNYQDGKRKNYESHMIVDSNQSTQYNINEGPTNHNLNIDSVKEDATDMIEDSHENRQVMVDDNFVSHENLSARYKRSSPTLMRLFRLMFVKPTTVADNKTSTVAANGTKAMQATRQSNQQDYNDAEDRYKKFEDLLLQINEILNKLDVKLSSFNVPERKLISGFITVGMPISFDSDRRSKRDVKNIINTTELESNAVNDNKTFIITTANVTKENNTKHSNESQINNTNDAITKIDAVLKDVQNEISAIKGIKDSVSSDEKFKVGYIVASLENLQLTLKRLTERIHARRSQSVANKFLGEVEHSKKIVTNLMEYLRMNTEMKTENKSKFL